MSMGNKMGFMFHAQITFAKVWTLLSKIFNGEGPLFQQGKLKKDLNT